MTPLYRIVADIRTTILIPGESPEDAARKTLVTSNGTVSMNLIERQILHGHYDLLDLIATEEVEPGPRRLLRLERKCRPRR